MQELGPLPIPLDKEYVSYDINIVAVHGLGGHLRRTWTYKQSRAPDGYTDGDGDVLWLEKLLPYDLPGAKVYSFGYDSTPVFSKSAAGVRDAARSLLEYLLNIVEDVSIPPSSTQRHTTNLEPIFGNRIVRSYLSVTA